MRKQLLFVFAIVLAVGRCLQAQSVPLKAEIPFNFVVGSTVYHAGAYTLKPIGLDGYAVQLQGADPNDSTIINPCTCVSERIPQHESKLVFQVVDGRYFLWQIWTEGYGAGREVLIKHPELEKSNQARAQLRVIPASKA